MTFEEVLAQIIEVLQREKRISYRALKRRFALDDTYLDDLKEELIYAKRLALDEDSRVLVWAGDGKSPEARLVVPVVVKDKPEDNLILVPVPDYLRVRCLNRDAEASPTETVTPRGVSKVSGHDGGNEC